jgi:glycosyltransferase involved in cell wall biosynthesis
MRLAIVAPHFPEYALRYAAAMARRCPVLAFVDDAQVAAEYEGRRMDTHGIERVHRIRFKTMWDAARLIGGLRRFRPTVVHLQEAVGPRRRLFNALVVMVFKRSARIALTVHDPSPHTGRDSHDARRGAWALGYVRRVADVIVVHGEHCARDYRPRLGPAQLLVVSEHGVVLEPETFAPAPAYPLRLYFFGRMEAYKGLDTLLVAVRQLHDAGQPFELAVEGHGPELERLGAAFEALPEVTVLRGFVPPCRVIEAIQQAHCVLLPYHNATQSGVLAAAFAGHRCVIASDVGGLRDVVAHGRNGLLVPASDGDALAGAIGALIADAGQWQRLQQGAAETARTQLNWDVITGGLIQALASPAMPDGARLRRPRRGVTDVEAYHQE